MIPRDATTAGRTDEREKRRLKRGENKSGRGRGRGRGARATRPTRRTGTRPTRAENGQPRSVLAYISFEGFEREKREREREKMGKSVFEGRGRGIKMLTLGREARGRHVFLGNCGPTTTNRFLSFSAPPVYTSSSSFHRSMSKDGTTDVPASLLPTCILLEGLLEIAIESLGQRELEEDYR